MHKIKKIAENNIEVTRTKTVFDTKGQEVEVWDLDSVISYGQEKLDQEKLSHEKRIKDIDSYSKTREKAKVQVELDILKEVQAKINIKTSKPSLIK